MKKKASSYSAEVVAVMRVVESRRKKEDLLFHDPFAEKLIRPLFRFLLSSRLMTRIICHYIDSRAPGFQGGIASLRTCFIDDLIGKCVIDGITQIVILGAGLDARAHRLDALKKISVFEIDLPATVENKKQKIEALFGKRSAHVAYIPVDLRVERTLEGLRENGYDTSHKTFFIWEGVTMYLNKKAFDKALSFIAKKSPPGSVIYFDYMRKAVLDGRCMLPESKKIRESKSFNGNGEETFTFGMEHEEVQRLLSDKGFTVIEDYSGPELEKKYSIHTRVHELFGYVHAVVN